MLTPITLTPERLLALAHRRELVQARRLAAREQLPLATALHRVLEQVAGTATVASLIQARIRERDATVARHALRAEEKRLFLVARKAAQAPDPLAWQGWFDGSAAPNPGRIGLGVLLRAPDGTLMSVCRAAGLGDSTVAEYLALIALLEQALAAKVQHLIVRGDSQVVIADLLGQVPVRSMHLQVYRQHARSLLGQFARVELVWIPRARNAAADALARQAQALPLIRDVAVSGYFQA